MAHYAYKHACYDIDYEKYKQLVKQFEQEEGREHDGDSNYDGDCWYIMEMWIRELRAKVAELESRASPASVPEGWKLVPVEPTQEMQIPSYLPEVPWPMRKQIYKDMIAAAPTPPVSEDRKDAERYRWLTSGKRRSWIWDCVLTEEEKATGNFLEEIIDASMQEDKP